MPPPPPDRPENATGSGSRGRSNSANMPSGRFDTAQRTGPTFSSSTKIDGVVAAGRLGDGDRRADGRVAGEGQFVHRREDAHLARCASFSGGRMNTVSDRLNSPAIACIAASSSPSGVEHHRQRIAGKSCAGEHVVDGKACACCMAQFISGSGRISATWPKFNLKSRHERMISSYGWDVRGGKATACMDQIVRKPRPETDRCDRGGAGAGLPKAGSKQRGRRRWLYALAAIAAIGAGAGAYSWLSQRAAPRSSTTPLPAEKGGLTVTVSATGTLQPLTQVDISSELSGVVRTVAVNENDLVNKGDVLAELDTTRLAAQVEGAEASAKAAAAKVDDARTTLKESEQALARAAAAVEARHGHRPGAGDRDRHARPRRQRRQDRRGQPRHRRRPS